MVPAPEVLKCVPLSAGRIELLEFRWPDMIDFVRAESELMLEMSLPPHSSSASAAFPRIDRDNYCFMGTLFLRYPDMVIHGRGEGDRSRVLRLVFTGARARFVNLDPKPPSIATLQGLLDIRSDSLRAIMDMALRELTGNSDHAREALEAIHALAVVELRRLLERGVQGTASGRLAGWQYRRIRERLLEPGPRPTTGELATLCGLSVRHLHRQFLALTGRTLSQYIEDFWVDRAKAMLATGDDPVRTIGFALGFDHANSFARAFRRATGMTPRAFRQSGPRQVG